MLKLTPPTQGALTKGKSSPPCAPLQVLHPCVSPCSPQSVRSVPRTLIPTLTGKSQVRFPQFLHVVFGSITFLRKHESPRSLSGHLVYSIEQRRSDFESRAHVDFDSQ